MDHREIKKLNHKLVLMHKMRRYVYLALRAMSDVPLGYLQQLTHRHLSFKTPLCKQCSLQYKIMFYKSICSL
jgi:hypothetical protein